jgi:hypothetical protein
MGNKTPAASAPINFNNHKNNNNNNNHNNNNHNNPPPAPMNNLTLARVCTNSNNNNNIYDFSQNKTVIVNNPSLSSNKHSNPKLINDSSIRMRTLEYNINHRIEELQCRKTSLIVSCNLLTLEVKEVNLQLRKLQLQLQLAKTRHKNHNTI